jgi:hypothetical protein
MNDINGQTVIAITMKQLLAAIAAIIILAGGVLWTVLTFTLGGMREDLATIRGVTVNLQAADKDTAVRSRDSENKLATEIGGLRTEIVALNGRLETFNVRMQAVDGAVTKLAAQVQEMQKALYSKAASLTEPKNLETFVASLRRAGVDDASKVFIVPIDGTFGATPLNNLDRKDFTPTPLPR